MKKLYRIKEWPGEGDVDRRPTGGISRQARQGRKGPCDDYLKLPLRALRALREAFFYAGHCSDSAPSDSACRPDDSSLDANRSHTN